jgi:hypothetical protein
VSYGVAPFGALPFGALPAATTGTYTLTAATGSYTLSGQAAGLTVTRRLTADAGAFALTGQAAGLRPARVLTAAVGAFTLTGNAAGLAGARRLTAAAGAFTLSGQDATLTYASTGNYVLTAAVGAYTLAGQAAALTYDPLTAYSLTAAVGAYSLIGQAATLTYSGASSGGGTTTTAAATTSTTSTAQTSTARVGNTLQPPPRLTGNVSQDVAILNSYIGDLYRSLALEADIVGTQETTTNNVSNVTNQVTQIGADVDEVYDILDGIGVQVSAALGVKAGSIPLENQTDALMEAVTACVALGGGTVRLPAGRNIRLGTTSLWPAGPVIPPNVSLEGCMAPDGGREAGGANAREYVKAPGIYLDSTARINLYGGSARDLFLRRTGFVDPVPGNNALSPFDPATMRQALDAAYAFAGTAIKIDGSQGYGADERSVRNVFAIGFDTIIHSTDAARVVLQDIYGDANNGILIEDSGGTARVARAHITSFYVKNLRGISAAYSPITNAFQEGSRIAITLGSTPSRTKQWATLKNYSSNARVYYGANEYKSRSTGISGDDPPVHTSGTVSDQGTLSNDYGVSWRYDKPYTGTAYLPTVWDGLLQTGDYVFVNVDPVWFGGDTISATTTPIQRGRVPIYAKHGSTADTWILDVPWDASLAAAMIGADMVVAPGSRPGCGFRSSNADTCWVESVHVKGPRVGFWLGGSAHVLVGCGVENAAEGESDADEGGNICVLLDTDAVDHRFYGCAFKSMATIVRCETQSLSPNVFTACEINTGGFRTIDMRRGTIQVQGGAIKGGNVFLKKRTFIEIRCDADDITLTSDDNGHDARNIRERQTTLNTSPRQTLYLGAPQGVGLVANKIGVEWEAGEVVAAGTNRTDVNEYDTNEYLYTTAAGGTCGTVTPQASPVKVTNADRLTNVVTATTNRPHNCRVGDTFTVTDASTTSFNGAFTVASVPDFETLTWAQAGADENCNNAEGVGTIYDGTTAGTGVLWRWVAIWPGGWTGVEVNNDTGTSILRAYDSAAGTQKDILTATSGGVAIVGIAAATDLVASGDLNIGDDATIGDRLTVGGTATFNGSQTANGSLTAMAALIVDPTAGSFRPPSYTVAALPGGSIVRVAFASDGRKNGEGAGLGTGVLVFHDGTAWRACDTGATVAA